MPKRIPEETKQRAIRLVLDHLDEYPTLTAACQSVGDRLGIGKESLRRWVRQAQVDAGEREGMSSSEQERIKQLERENRELREANAACLERKYAAHGRANASVQAPPRIAEGPALPAQGRTVCVPPQTGQVLLAQSAHTDPYFRRAMGGCKRQPGSD